MDIKCVVCKEPWDSYGVDNGDMLPWEAKLFRQGAGCPCCEGIGTYTPPQTFADIENGDGDPMERLSLYEQKTRPVWERPNPTILWTCEGCGVEVIRNPDNNELEYHLPHKAKGARWYSSHPYSRGEPEAEPSHVFSKDGNNPRPVCEFCHDHCYHCHADICGTIDYSDTYDEGNSFPYETYYAICIGCVETQCEQCNGWDCDCKEE